MPTTYAIVNGATAMAATTFTSVSGTNPVVNTVNGVGFKPDLVWIKARSNAQDHYEIDSVRGGNYLLRPNQTNAESTASYWIDSFNSNGFTTNTTQLLNIGYNYVAWQWKAGGTAVTNTSGTISSQVSANPTAGFSIVTWTGNGVTAATVGHGLNAVPAMIICKERSGTDYWHIKHKSMATTVNGFFNTLVFYNAATVGDGVLADLSSSTTFGFVTAGSPGNVVAVNENGITNVAYCWSEVEGYSKFGSYTGNGSTDGPFVYLGFRPRWVMIKRTDSTDDWIVFDTSRNTYDVMNSTLFPNGNYSETTDSNRMIDVLSNGFKIRSSPVYINASGGTYIYACFAENPFKYANAR